MQVFTRKGAGKEVMAEFYVFDGGAVDTLMLVTETNENDRRCIQQTKLSEGQVRLLRDILTEKLEQHAIALKAAANGGR